MNAAASSVRPRRNTQWLIYLQALGACFLAAAATPIRAADPPVPAAILQDLHSFNDLGSVLHIAAHPDDENTQLLTYLARGRGCRTAYLSLTRGDGGQNLLGPEFGETLGLLRTQELLAARRLDGARQYFTRAIDFGFSKDYVKTVQIWDKQQVLSDVVRVIRTFRPDVIVTRFSPLPSGTHGHHTASAFLALEAFKLAGNREAFPEQLTDLNPWQPKRILMNGGGGGGRGGAALRLDIGGNDPVLHVPFSDIASRSRAMHKTQGFGNFGGGGGGRGGGGARQESFQLLDGQAATKDIFEGIDTTWARVPGGADIGPMTEKVIAEFDAKNPAASVPALLTLRSRVPFSTKDVVVNDKRQQLDRVLIACLGLEVTTVVPQAEIVPGEALKMHHSAIEHSSVPVKWVAMRYPGIGNEIKAATDLTANQPAARDAAETLPVTTPLSQPYWLRKDHTEGLFTVSEPYLIGRPENPPVLPVEFVFEVGGQTLVVADEPVQVVMGHTKEIRRRLEVIPPVSLSCGSAVELFAPGAKKPVTVEVTASRADTAGELKLDAPADWKVEPANQPFKLGAIGERARFTFTVTAPSKPTTGRITARVQVGGATFSNQRLELHYDHLPPLLLQPEARIKAVCLDLAVAGKKVGYVPGAGDSVADSLKQMGYEVTQLTGADLTADKLRDFDAIVIGVRAFNTRKDLAANMPALFAFVEGGGNVVVQYNRPNGLVTNKIAPFDLRVGQERVTDKDSKMTFLAPEHPALNVPNKITAADFEGWVQERGIYFPSSWGKQFTPLFACNDPDSDPLKGGTLVAQHGKGYFVYTSYSWFRQLPDGVPGAYRIFANLVSLGKK
jgi:LmbE family N-acetylglucosaminyl deacetylase